GARSGSPRRAFASSRPVLGSLSREAAAGVTNSEERAVAEKRRALRSAARSEPRLNLPPGVERVAESIADEVDRQHDDEDAEPREDHPVRCDVDEVAGVEEEPAPGRDVRREAEAEERERGLGEDRAADTDRRGDEHRRQRVREDVAEDDASVTVADAPRGLDELLLLE